MRSTSLQREISKQSWRNLDLLTEELSRETITLSGTDYYKEIRDAWGMGVSLTILEVGFIDSSDITIIINNIDKIGLIIAQELAKLCDKTIPTPAPTPTPAPAPTGVKYRVVCGTYADKANAIAQQEKLKKAGFDSFLVAI